MINTLKSMGQSVQSLGNKALAHPHWAGKTGFAVLTVTLVVLCGIAAVFGAVLYVLVVILRRSDRSSSYTDDPPLQYDGFPDGRHHSLYDCGDPRSWTEDNDQD